MTRPATIFKYEALSFLSLQNLKRQSVYFASPREFNDPYDSTLNTEFAQPTASQLKELREHFLADPHCPVATKEEIRAADDDQLLKLLVPVINAAVANIKDQFLSGNGITCFSERNDSLLMWSHYGGRHGGICLEFRTDYEPFTKLRKVNYVNDIPLLNLRDFVVKPNSADQLLDIYCTKFDAWQYEREWRARHKESGKLFGYEAKALKAIYFGPKIEGHMKDMVCLILAGQNPDVELWQGHHRKDRFEIYFEKFTYTTIADAKRLGLSKPPD